MIAEKKTIIISDLHIGHPASHIHEPAQLAPIFRESEAVVFNGDTVEWLWQNSRALAEKHLDHLADLCDEMGVHPTFITGNHDPQIAGFDHLELGSGEILVTHGDVLFHDIAPWSPKDAKIVASAHRRILNRLKRGDLVNLEKRLKAIKRAAATLEDHCLTLSRGPLACLSLLAHVMLPPTNLLRVLRSWRQTPRRAAALAQLFRPRSKFVFIGHTHRAGIWEIGKRVVVNTGSFLPYSRKLAIIVEGSLLEVRKIIKRCRNFELGKTVARFRLRPLEQQPAPESGLRECDLHQYFALGNALS